MKIFVTGGAGYIGSVTCDQLLRAGHQVIVFDNLSQGHREAVPAGAAFIEADLADPAAIRQAFENHRPEAVMHFASKTLVGESMQHPFLYIGDNVTNGLNLLRAVIDHGINKFILSSTANLFDRPEKVPIDETAPVVPGSPYGESKFMLERMLYWLDRTRGLRYACLRFFNAAGGTESRGEDHDPEFHIIPIVLQVALGQRKEVTIFGDDYPTRDGTCVRDYIHVHDLAAAHILALGALDQGSRTYNLGNGQGFTVKEVVDTARAITGHPIPVKMGPRRPGDPAVLVASSDRIQQELGWKTQYPTLQSIIESAWQWHSTHPRGYATR